MRPALANIITARVPEADLLIDYMTVRPQGNRAFLISDTIRRLKAADIWAKLDVLWMLAAHDAPAARLNWKTPASFALTAVNSPTFTADRGYAGNGTTSYLNTGWDHATNAVQFTRDSNHLMSWSRTTYSGSIACDFGAYATPGPFFNRGLAVQFNTSNKSVFLSNESGLAVANTAAGMTLGVRRSSASTEMYVNSVSVGTGSQASKDSTSLDVYICGLNFDGSFAQATTRQIAAVGIGNQLSAQQQAACYNIVQSYMTAIGAA